MAFCQVCGKTKQYGHNVSHSKRRTKRVFMPNVLRKKMFIERPKLNGTIRRIKICAKCLKRAKMFGKVAAQEHAVLSGASVKVVNWLEKAKAQAKNQQAAAKEKRQAAPARKEISVAELVGKNKN